MPGQPVNPSEPGGVARDPLIVLKFGGSVLGRERDAARAVHEVYRWVRQGYRVVAVVSALEGQTDQLLSEARRWTGAAPSQIACSATAALVATGEQRSAALLGLALDRAGIPVEVLDHAAVGLRTSGPALDATPIELDVAALNAALDRVPAVIVPGFTGRDQHGRVTLLGRGGSDLSALFIAQRLGKATRCRLVKDVDGLYDKDPAAARADSEPVARRYSTLSWDDALALDGTIVQHKGVRFARAHGLCFEVAALLGEGESRVGPWPAVFDDRSARVPVAPLSVTVLGAGVVGGGVVEALAALPGWFEVVCVTARDLEKAAGRGVPRQLLTRDVDLALERESDVVVELLGGLDPARSLVRRAIESGRAVVTANKAIIADAGSELDPLAQRNDAALAYSAAVGGAVVCLETARRLAAQEGVVAFEGVLNGTTNFVLGRVAAGAAFDHAVRAAQDAGFAEADPSRDLDGRDAADKVVLLARAAFGADITPQDVERVGLDAHACATIAPSPGLVLKHLARAELVPGNNGQVSVRASVRPAWVESSESIGQTQNEQNAIVFTTATGRRVLVHGKGAGRWPTAEAVVADLLEIARQRLRREQTKHFAAPSARVAEVMHGT